MTTTGNKSPAQLPTSVRSAEQSAQAEASLGASGPKEDSFLAPPAATVAGMAYVNRDEYGGIAARLASSIGRAEQSGNSSEVTADGKNAARASEAGLHFLSAAWEADERLPSSPCRFGVSRRARPAYIHSPRRPVRPRTGVASSMRRSAP